MSVSLIVFIYNFNRSNFIVNYFWQWDTVHWGCGTCLWWEQQGSMFLFLKFYWLGH